MSEQCEDLDVLGGEQCQLEAGHDGMHRGEGSIWGDLPGGGWTWIPDSARPADEVVVEAVEVLPLEERLRAALVAGGLGAGVVALVLLVAAFVLAVVARWQPAAGRALDGTAVLSLLAASVVGVLAVVAVRYGIGRPDDEPVVDEVRPGESWEASVRTPPAGESGVSRGRDGGR